MSNPLEKVVTKTAGKVAGIRARMEGLTGVFNLLAQQHKEAKTMLDRLGTTDNDAKRKELWSEVRRELLSHERAELSEVYPALQARAETQDIVRRHGDEARQLEVAIGKVDALSVDSPNWSIAVAELTRLVEAHAKEEETNFFPRALEVLGDDAAAKLEAPFEAAQARLKNQIQLSA